MGHYSEEDLILHYYGEYPRGARIERHLAACRACASEMEAIRQTLALPPPQVVPERNELYGLEVWQRIRSELPEPPDSGWLSWIRVNAFASAALLLLVAVAFAASRMWPAGTAGPPAAVMTRPAASDSTERTRLAAIADHLERSERVLLDVVNAPGGRDGAVDISDEQVWASELIDANRLYRDAALTAGDDGIAVVLDLLEFVHGPSTLTEAELEDLRLRFNAAALLFRVRILSDELQQRVVAPVQNRTTT
jgi:hypothetical protein